MIVGSAWPNRVVALEKIALSERTPHYFRLVSNACARAISQRLSRGDVGHGAVRLWRLRSILGQSKFSLLLDREFSLESGALASDTPGPRLFEAMAAGCCVLCDDRTAQTVERQGLRAGEHFLSFGNMEALTTLLATLNSDTLTAQLIADAGYMAVVNDHTFDRRLSTIFESFSDVVETTTSNYTTIKRTKSQKTAKYYLSATIGRHLAQ